MGIKQSSISKNQIDLVEKFALKKFTEAGAKNHFLEVFQILQDEFNVDDHDVLVAGLLHDTLEDTSATYEEIKRTFSKRIADLVQEVSHPKYYTQKQRQEYYEKIKTISSGAKLIKMADFASHLRNFIKIYEKGEQHLYPKFVNNDKYITQIREFLTSCKDSAGKELVFELTNRLETFLKKISYSTSAGGIVLVEKDGKLFIAVIERKRLKDITLPKGQVKPKESFKETAVREVKEETGLKTKLVKYLGSFKYKAELNDRIILKTVHWFLMKAIGGEPRKTNREISKVRLVPVESNFSFLTYNTDQKMIKKAKRFVKII